MVQRRLPYGQGDTAAPTPRVLSAWGRERARSRAGDARREGLKALRRSPIQKLAREGLSLDFVYGPGPARKRMLLDALRGHRSVRCLWLRALQYEMEEDGEEDAPEQLDEPDVLVELLDEHAPPLTHLHVCGRGIFRHHLEAAFRELPANTTLRSLSIEVTLKRHHRGKQQHRGKPWLGLRDTLHPLLLANAGLRCLRMLDAPPEEWEEASALVAARGAGVA